MNLSARAVLVAITLLAAQAASAVSLFRTPVFAEPGATSGPTSGLITADFTGDGGPDIAILQMEGRLVVLPSNAVDPFGARKVTEVPAFSCERAAAGDVNGDGKQDVVVTMKHGQLLVLLGKGDGTFTTGETIATAAKPGPIQLADANADGKLDAIVATSAGFADVLALHLGTGTGSFGAPMTTSSAGWALNVYAADVNGDGRADAIVETASRLCTRVYLGSATGFGTFVFERLGSGGVAIGNLNGDSAPDLVLGNGGRSDVEVLAGNGNGTFTTLATYGVAPFPTEVALADTNRDGTGDIIAMTKLGITVLRGAGNGTFGPAIHSADGSWDELAVADFNADGTPDIVSNDGGIAFRAGNGDGTFGFDRVYVAAHTDVFDLEQAPGVVTDMNGDGRPDVVMFVETTDMFWELAVLFNDGAGGLLPAVRTPVGKGWGGVFTLGRLNADAHLDAVIARGDHYAVYLGQAGGTFILGTGQGLFAFGDRPFLADLTGDGKLDLVNGSLFSAGDGAGSFGPIQDSIFARLAGDFDRNGKLDVVGMLTGGEIAVVLNSAGPPKVPAVTFPEVAARPAALADFNDDTFLDIFAISGDSTEVYVFPGNGDGTFGARLTTFFVSPGEFAANDYSFPTGDFDGDGFVDVAIGTVVLLGNGDGRFRDANRDLMLVERTAAGDFNADGRDDLAVFYRTSVRIAPGGLVPAPVRPATIELRSDIPHSEYGEEIPFLVAMQGGPNVSLGGTVRLSADGVPFGLVPLESVEDLERSAFLRRAIPAGTHIVTATFTGGRGYMPSTAQVQQTVSKATAAMTASAPGASPYGQNFTLSTTFSAPTQPYLPGPAAARTIRTGTTTLGVTWNGDEASVSGLAAGTWPLFIEFPGDANYLAASTSVSKVIQKKTPVLNATALPAGTARIAGPVTFQVAIPSGDYGSATGSVNVSIDGTSAGAITLASGAGELTKTLAAGTYSVSFAYGGDANHQAVTLTITVPVFAAPAATPVLTARVSGGNAVITWTPIAGAASYTLYRRSTFAQAWQPMGIWTTSQSEPIPANTTWMYAVAARDSAGVLGPMSAPDLATSVAFTDDSVIRGTRIKAAHVTQLRTAVNAVRVFAGFAPVTFTDTTPVLVRAIHLNELRTALSQARSAIGMPVTFTDPVLTARTSIVRAVHIEELRNATR